jgi:hypothetical protein
MSCLPRHSTILFGMRFRTTPEWRGTRRKESFSGPWDTPAQGTSTHPLLKGIYDATVKITEAECMVTAQPLNLCTRNSYVADGGVNKRPCSKRAILLLRNCCA